MKIHSLCRQFGSFLTLFGLGFASLGAAQAATLIGAGAGAAGASADGAGGRTNVDKTF